MAGAGAAAAADSQRAVVWTPNPGGQYVALTCPVWEIFIEGNRGSGKTDVALARFLRDVGKGLGSYWRGIVFRREYKHLDDLVVKSRRFFRQACPGARWLNSKSDYKWVFPDGEELLFRTVKDASDYWDYHGHEYPFVHFEELTNWPDDGAYEALKSVCRSSNPNVHRVYMSNGNPFGVGHAWVKERFVDIGPPGTVVTDKDGNQRVRIRIMLEENPHLMQADPQYAKRLEGIGNDALRRAWRYGDWDIAVGGFLQGIWDHDRHVVEPFPIPLDWPRWRACDWGFARPYSVGWYTIDPDGVIYRYRELYGYGGKANVGTRESVEEVARRILDIEALERKAGVEFRRNPIDSAVWASNGGMRIDGREQTIGELFHRHGIRWVPAKKGPGSRISGAQVLIQRLQTDTFKVFSTCKHWLRTVPVLMPDEDNWEDIDTEQEDHCFALDTEVLTPDGGRRLRDLLGTEGWVASTDGWRRYRSCRVTRTAAQLVVVKLSSGEVIRCTPDHRFIGEDGEWVEAKDLQGRKILSCSLTPSRFLTGAGSTGAGSTSPGSLSADAGSGCTEPCGSTTTARYRMGIRSIIGTTTLRTTALTTWSWCRSTIISATTRLIKACTSWVASWAGVLQPSGTIPRQVVSGTGRITSGICESCTPSAVSPGTANTAEKSTGRRGRQRPVPAIARRDAELLRVESVSAVPGLHPVACLTVPDTGAFQLATGPLVSNCYDETRYSLVSRHNAPERRVKEDTGPKPGTFDWLCQPEPRRKHPYQP